MDGQIWKPYPFDFKPGDLKKRPGPAAPYQPRLDWQMWFAALGRAEQNPWFIQFCVKLLEGSPQVNRLLDHPPFDGKPPKHIRAVVYDYRFTDIAEKKRSGAWWKREYKGIYLPPISLRRGTEPAESADNKQNKISS